MPDWRIGAAEARLAAESKARKAKEDILVREGFFFLLMLVVSVEKEGGEYKKAGFLEGKFLTR
jgi:hypothetical protein